MEVGRHEVSDRDAGEIRVNFKGDAFFMRARDIAAIISHAQHQIGEYLHHILEYVYILFNLQVQYSGYYVIQ